MTSLVLSLNIWKLKYSTLTDRMDSSTLLYLISLPLEGLLFVSKTHRSTWDSFLIGSLLSTNTSTIIWTKPSQWSNAWSCLGTYCKESTQFRNTYCIDAVYSLLLYTVINYSSITKLSYCTTWKSWGKCKEELLFGY